MRRRADSPESNICLKERIKTLLHMFLTFFKIGAICFGGGYTMIGVIEHEMVEKKKWLTSEEMLNIIAIAESSPGPISVNTATYVGTKQAGLLGALTCTLGMVLPAFLFILGISFFIDEFQSYRLVAYAFRGIRACVLVLILNATLRMFKKIEKTVFSILVMLLTFLVLVLTSFPIVYLLLICATVGIIYNFLKRMIVYMRGD